MENFKFENKSYLISLLIVSRKNPEGIKKLINNFNQLADQNLDNYEFIVKIDYDDKESIEATKEFSNKITNVKFIISSQLKGYPSLNEFVRDAAFLARGKYIMPLGDDTEMVTHNWNQVLEERLKETKFYACNFNIINPSGGIVNIKHCPEPEWIGDRSFIGKVGVNYHDFIYMIYPKKIIELWGFVSPHALVDNWIGDLAKRISIPPWNVPVYEFIDNIELNHHNSIERNKTPDGVFEDYLLYINDEIFYDCANKVKEYVEWEKWNHSHKLNIVCDFNNSKLSLKDYFKLP